MHPLLKLGKITKKRGYFTLQFDNNPAKEILLTKREYEVFKLLASGKTAKNMADALNISPRTVEKYICNLKDKFHVERKTELISVALKFFLMDNFSLISDEVNDSASGVMEADMT